MTNNCAHCGKPEKEHRIIDGYVRCVGISNSSFETREGQRIRHKSLKDSMGVTEGFSAHSFETVKSFLLDKLKDYDDSPKPWYAQGKTHIIKEPDIKEPIT